MSQTFFYGCVENREDPLRLGRYQVRIVGIHPKDKTQMSTSELPWATCLQPTTSAATSGIGMNPGLVSGSWVLVVFTNDDYQVPVILGSVAGIPGSVDDIDNSPKPPPPEEATPTQKEAGVAAGVYNASVLQDGQPYLGSLTKAQYDSLISAIRFKESSNNYSIVNSIGYIGAYQFGVAGLEDLGYIKKGTFGAADSKVRPYGKNAAMDVDENWTGKDGITSKSIFLQNTSVQDKCMLLYTQRSYKIMLNKNQISSGTDPRVLAGLLGVAHNQGTGAVSQFLRGEIKADGYGTTTQKYYDLCYRAIVVRPEQTTNDLPPQPDAEAPQPVPPQEEVVVTKRNDVNQNDGFNDPERKYPLWRNEADTSRLARGQNLDNTIVKLKDLERKRNISIALSEKTWSQPSIPFGAKYPYNHVTQTESGHVFELDDSPRAERVHLYHKEGTFIEIDVGGNQTNKIVGHGIQIIEQDGYVSIKGNGHITVEGNFTLHTDNAFIEMNNVMVKAQDVRVECETFDVKAKTKFAVESETITLKSSVITHLESSGKSELIGSSAVHVLSGGVVAADGSAVHLNSGVASSTSISPISDLDKFTKEVMNIQAVSAGESASAEVEHTNVGIVNASEEASTSEPQTAEAPSIPEPSSIVPAQVVQVSNPAPAVAPITSSAPTTVEVKKPNMNDRENIQLSPNFKLKALCGSSAFPFGGQHSLTGEQLVENLQYLCVNILEPIKAKYGSRLKINSGIRLIGNPNAKKSGNPSQHELGEAVDIGFTSFPEGVSKQEFMYQAVQEIAQFVPYDQLLLEFEGKEKAWIHISCTTRQRRRQTFTYNNHVNVGQGFKLIRN